MILIVGGTGALGSNLARRLLEKGKQVRVMTRTPEKAEPLKTMGAEVIKGDLLDRASLDRACAGVTAIAAAAHSILGRGKQASRYVDLQGHMDLIDVAKAAGVGHFVYTSHYDYGAAYREVPLFRFKPMVEDYLRKSGLSFTILRPTAFMESQAEIFIGKQILESGRVVILGKGDKPRNFVAADDVAQFAVMALENPDFKGEAIDIGGPENLTNLEVVGLYEKLSGQPAKVIHIPLWVLEVMYRVLRPFHAGLSQIMQLSILVDTTDGTFDTAPMLERFPVKLIRFEDWVHDRVRSGAVLVRTK